MSVTAVPNTRAQVSFHMKAVVYAEKGKFEIREKPKPSVIDATDAIVRVTTASICTSDLHIRAGAVPRAVPGITVGHEFVGVVEEVGKGVSRFSVGDRVAVNVETFCGHCFYCRHGWVNNCTDPAGGWAMGCRIDGCQTEYVRVPFADNGLTPIPAHVSDEKALFTGDLLSTGYWAADIGEVSEGDVVAIIGAGPSGIAAAYFLARNGFKCVIFERGNQIGGALNLIPHERLPKDAILKDWEFVNNSDLISVVFESDISNPSELFSQGFDEVLIAGGEPNCAKLNIEGEDLAVSYLEYLAQPEKYITTGNVAVIGGGNVAADCAIVAQAQGAVYVEMFVRRGLSDMRITPAERHEILERKINISAGTSPDKIIKTGEKYSLFVHKNRFNGEKWEPISDTSVELPDFDLIIRAIGAKADEKQFDSRLIYIGDCKTGGSTLVEAMADAKNTAFELIKKYQA